MRKQSIDPAAREAKREELKAALEAASTPRERNIIHSRIRYWSHRDEINAERSTPEAKAFRRSQYHARHNLPERLVCPVCGKEFDRARYSRKYCSRECACKAVRERSRRRSRERVRHMEGP